MSATARNQVFSAVHTIGGLIPADMLLRIAEGRDVTGSKPADYRVVGSRSVRDDAERHWDYLKSIWKDLRDKLPVAPEAETPADPTGLAVTQWLEPLFDELGFGRLAALGAAGIASDDGSKTFAISHRWNHTPIHLAPWNATLDKRPGGAGTVPPQSLVQECLNRSEAHLWGVLTNGRQLRLLRDSSAMATAAYVEFDLEAIFDGELFSEFVLLYRLLHVSRFDVADGAAPSSCWLEKWRAEAIAAGTRALDQLRKGVQDAITALGTGFLRHPDNGALREDVDPQALHNALLRLVYRLLFLFVAEDRDALHAPDADEQARERYAGYFSSARLRAQARRRRGTSHSDLYQALRIVLDALGDENGRPELGLPGLGGLFDDNDADAPLHGLTLSNDALLTAIRHLSLVRDTDSRRWRSVDYRNLDAEELGSIYESLLELVPKHSAVDRTFELVELAGNTRKTTGSYYTPSSLIECLLDSALDPVIDDAVKRGEQAATAAGQPDPSDAIVSELLSLTVCDPACGSGHFLVAAARRIAKQVAAVRERNPEPTVDAVRHALHEVVAGCIYGVDLNPMAVELAKVSLWMEALEPGNPLSFLDAHVKCGNSLIGATPALLKRGIPDEAFIATEGDDKKHAKALEKINLEERRGQSNLFDIEDKAVKVANASFASSVRCIAGAPSGTLREVRDQAVEYARWVKSPDYVNALYLADAWCSSFMWIKKPDAPRAVTHGVFRSLEDPTAYGASIATHDEIVRLRHQYSFFHWHLEFPEVFSVPEDGRGVSSATGWAGGFDCVLGNPPWDSIELKEQEFFARRSPAIAAVSKADARKKLIAKLQCDPDTLSLYNEYAEAKRTVYAESHFLRRSGRVPLTGQGNLNTYAVFSETGRLLIGSGGRAGVIVPTGIATDARTQYFFKDLVANGSITSLYDFENRSGLFPAVDSRMKFAILSIAGRGLHEPAARFAFFLHDPTELADAGKSFTLTPQEINLLNPNTGTCPVFRSRRDAEITLGIYRRVPVLVEEGAPAGNPWNVSFMTMFHMSHESHLFHMREELESDGWALTGNVFAKGAAKMLPLYEAKMLHHYDHRWATYREDDTTRDLRLEEKQDAAAVVLPRYWVREREVDEKLASRHWKRDWLLGWRDITNSTNERTAISFVFPKAAVGNKVPLMYSNNSPQLLASLISCQSSFAHDFATRQKVGGTTMNIFLWQQLPVLTPSSLRRHSEWVSSRILELAFISHDMAPFARDLGDEGPPFRWDEGRRAIIRAELDALFLHLYGVSRDDVDYLMETFPIVKRKDEAKHGTYRTKELILVEYDRMAAAEVSLTNPLIDGETYTSTLTPPPGHGPRHPAAPTIPRQRAGESEPQRASQVRPG
ncbi:Eco57I restriction-modification methylase domain-containing protein [Micromonospora mirobrigensis]|uniref:site-specific DNA-methyltransferase (adenine-specific) n=1 Tax=Micromonospora mirobrigensis TaxID=262898 RepID=A0A1C4WSZ4_9ACTN|nr:DNA methyltransferase [Micromonospora mirobrigensis]SCE99289.1 Methyltransferase domain-containing protein [Micromonospora mirobrigensis]